MPILAAFLVSALTELVKFFGRRVAERAAITLATLTLIAAAWATLFGAIVVLLGTLSLAVPASLVGAIQLIAPTGFKATISAWVGIEISLAAYRKFKETQYQAMRPSASGMYY